jgi:hypothetical protein
MSLKSNFVKYARNIINRFGVDIVRFSSSHTKALVPDLNEIENTFIMDVRPYTMTSVDKMATLITAVKYLTENKIPGDIVECGVWRGGSMMLAAKVLSSLGDTGRHIHLYDTFEGMPAPTKNDTNRDGRLATDLLAETKLNTGVWCYADIDDVKRNMTKTGYPIKNVFFIKGKVEDTIPKNIPEKIALLRIDTDWYDSTKHELHHLFPRLVPNGILIIDDYGYWNGAKKAVDEYFSSMAGPAYLHRIGTSGRVIVKNV